MTNAYDAEIQQDDQEQQPPAQPRQQQQRGSPYDGMIAENAQGHRVVYRSAANGRGRWVELNPASADPDSRETLTNERALLSRLRDTSRLAESFIDHNTQSGTGGFGQSQNEILGFQFGVPAWRAPHRQAMQGLSAEMVRSNIRPGMASTMNSDAEQLMAARTYPNEQASGDVNAERAVRVLVSRDTQIELVRQMEEWLTRHPNLAGFQEHWQQIEPGVRDHLTQMHVRRFGSRTYGFRNLNDRGVYEPGAGDNRPATPQGETVQFRRNPQTGEIERVR